MIFFFFYSGSNMLKQTKMTFRVALCLKFCPPKWVKVQIKRIRFDHFFSIIYFLNPITAGCVFPAGVFVTLAPLTLHRGRLSHAVAHRACHQRGRARAGQGRSEKLVLLHPHSCCFLLQLKLSKLYLQAVRFLSQGTSRSGHTVPLV